MKSKKGLNSPGPFLPPSMKRSPLCLLRRFRNLPVVQIMGDFMAVAAFGELGHDAGGMRFTVAVPALRNGLVFVLMAEGTFKVFMLCSACLQEIICLLVACGAELRSHVSIGHYLRHMGLMTSAAVCLGHLF